jgi:hypothetical protein
MFFYTMLRDERIAHVMVGHIALLHLDQYFATRSDRTASIVPKLVTVWQFLLQRIREQQY